MLDRVSPIVLLALVVTVGLVSAAPAGAAGSGSASPVATRAANDFLLILDRRAGPYRYLDSFDRKCCTAYEDALAAFGPPSRYRADANLCHVTWVKSGITVGFASSRQPCRSDSLLTAEWYGIRLFRREWHNTKGLHVGQSIARVRRLPASGVGRVRPAPGRRWLVLSRRRVDELNFVRLAVEFDRLGRVIVIHVPATYIY